METPPRAGSLCHWAGRMGIYTSMRRLPNRKDDSMAITFSGGIHIPGCKGTKTLPIVDLPAPEIVKIPLQQHIGAPAKALVKKGDIVKAGQLIGKNDDALSCYVHASIPGLVLEIEAKDSYTGNGKTQSVVIKNDWSEAREQPFPFEGEILSITADQLIEIVKQAGISGMGGATFPTYAKIASAVGKASKLIINCAECEPFLTANHRLMLEEPDRILNGAKILMIALGIKHATIAIEDNKRDAAQALAERTGTSDLFEIRLLKTKYPQGDERQLMAALYGRELPQGKLPADLGCVIFNAETSAAIFDAVVYGRPLISRVVTVDGDCVAEPNNLRVPIGTSFAEVLEFCGGMVKPPDKLISGGPMMGTAQWDPTAVVTKGTAAILALSSAYEKKAAPACIHCGKCVSVCPMHLMPNYLALFAKAGDLEQCERYDAPSCVECGCCAYLCPGNVPIVQYIRAAKGKISEEKKKAAK